SHPLDIPFVLAFFFYIDAAPPQIFTLSLHDALPISSLQPGDRRVERPRTDRAVERAHVVEQQGHGARAVVERDEDEPRRRREPRSEEHTSELQSRGHLVCRLLLEKKKGKGVGK